MRVQRIVPAVALTVALTSAPLTAQTADTTAMIDAARITAEYALLLLDQERYDEAWPLFTDVWRRGRGGEVAALVAERAESRTYVGVVADRNLAEAVYTTELPQALPGRYVVLMYSSMTVDGAAVEEEVLMVPVGELAWGVSSYRVSAAAGGAPAVAVSPEPETPVAAAVDPKASGGTDPIQVARAVADELLPLLDQGNYRDAWPLFGDVYRRGRDGFEGLAFEIDELRGRFGYISRRELVSEDHGTDLPMALPGEYVQLVYNSVTDSGASVQEELLLGPAGGGAWAASGYFVRELAADPKN